jgi:hypothetical protein
MRKIYSQVVEAKILDLKLQIKQIKLLEDIIPKWSKKIQINHKSEDGISKAIGVYKIFYAPTGQLMAIGQGNISNRRQRHLSIFRNKGNSIFHSSSGASEGSQTGTKMYKFDKNINNWLFSWCDCGNKQIAMELENYLITKLKPKFNLQSMAGVN